jgi:hypothetical protein
MEVLRRPRTYFDEGQHAPNVTFDDGESIRRSLPWSHFHSSEWGYADPTAIRVEIGEWQVVISGHNLEALFRTIEAAKLLRICAHPEFSDDPAHEADVFATRIRFIHQESAVSRRRRPVQLPRPI